MTRMLKLDFYRLFKGRVFYVVIIVLMLVSTFVPALMNAATSVPSTENNGQNNKQPSVAIIDTSNLAEQDITYSEKIEMICEVFSGNVVPVALIVFSALFAGAYKRTKFEKNIVGSVQKRWHFVISNAIVCVFVSVVVIALMLCGSAIFNSMINPRYAELPFGSISKLSLFTLSYYALLVSVACMMSCFIRLLKNHIVGLVIALVYGRGIIYAIVDLLLSPVFGSDFTVESFLPLGTMYNMSVNMNNIDYYRAICIALIFGLASIVIDIMVNNKRDVVC